MATLRAAVTMSCSACGEEKPAGEFGKGRKQCKPCAKSRRAASDAAWRAANKERNAAKNRRLYLENRETVLARQAERRASLDEQQKAERAAWYHDYYMTNRERILAAERERIESNPAAFTEKRRAYRRANPEKTAEASRRYHARRRGAAVVEPGVTWHTVSARDGMGCSYCGVECNPSDGHYVLARDGANRWVCGPTYPTVDHVVPVSLGGHHAMNNAVLSCNRCNKRKGARKAL